MITVEKVEEAYEKLIYTTNNEEREKMNVFLTQFQELDEAWQISEQLLGSLNTNSQFLGAKVISHKIRNNFQFLADKHIELNLRDILLQLIENENIKENVFKTLSICVSLIGINCLQSTWSSLIQDLINFGGRSRRAGLGTLNILGEIYEEADSGGFKYRFQSYLKKMMIENSGHFLDFVYSIFSGPCFDQETGKAALVALKGWGSVCGSLILTHIGIKDCLLKLMEDESAVGLIIDIINECLGNSEYTKIIDNTHTLQQAIAELGEAKIMPFISDTILYLKNVVPLFKQRAGTGVYSAWAAKIAELTTMLAENFSLLLFENSEQACTLLECLVVCMSHKYKRIVSITFNGWDMIKTNLPTVIKQGVNVDHLFEYFPSVIHLLLLSSKYPSLTLALSDEPDTESEIEDLQLSDYRLYVADMFYNIYYMYKLRGGTQGEDMFCNLLRKYLDSPADNMNNIEYLTMAESCLHAYSGVMDVLQIEEEEIPFMKYLILKILSFPRVQIIQHGALFLMYEGSRQFAFNTDLYEQSLEFILSACGDLHLQSIATKTILEISEFFVGEIPRDIEVIAAYAYKNMDQIEQLNLGRLAKALGNKCVQLNYEQISTTLDMCSETSLIQIHTMEATKNEDKIFRLKLSKYLQFLIDLMKPLLMKECDKSIIEISLLPKLTQIWGSLCQYVEYFYNYPDIIQLICTLIEQSLKSIHNKMTPLFEQIAKPLINCFTMNPKNNSCVQIFAISASSLFMDEKYINMMTPSLNPLINLILKKLTPNPNSISTDIDVVLIAKFADFMSRALECFTTPILQSENLQRIITFFGNSLSQVREFNCNKQIFHFFTYFCNLKGSGQEQIILSYVSFISYHALLSTASISRNLYSSNASVINALLQVNEEETMKGIIEAFKCPIYGDIKQTIKEICIRCIIGFKGQNAPLKNLLQDLGNYMQRQVTEDTFISHELILESRKKRTAASKAPVIVID